MNRRIEAAENAVHTAAEHMNEVGLTDRLRDLVREVWNANLARHEPEELGDTNRSLGFQCSENLRELAVRRILGDQVLAEDRWIVRDLQVTSPHSVLTLKLPGFEIVLMKVPSAHGRNPSWEQFRPWEAESQVRNEIAKENARVLGGSRLQHERQTELEFAEDCAIGVVRRMMVLWAGDTHDGMTSAWLAVPVDWLTTSFAAKTSLWRDELGDSPVKPTRAPRFDGPAFDQRQTAEPQVTLKPRPAAADEA